MNTCKVCGCTDYRACNDGCYWVNNEKDLCSKCVLGKLINFNGYNYKVINISNSSQIKVIKIGVVKSNTYYECFNRIMKRIISWPKYSHKDLVKELQEFKLMYETGRFADFYLELTNY